MVLLVVKEIHYIVIRVRKINTDNISTKLNKRGGNKITDNYGYQRVLYIRLIPIACNDSCLE
jgi:hypothetical protein